MPDQSGGAPRFRNAGTLWKSGWKKNVDYQEMCCFSDFNFDLFGQRYSSAPGILPIVPANGFFLGMVVGLRQMPAGTEPLVENGNVANEGYRLEIAPVDATNFNFVFTVFDGAGVAATVSAPGTIISLSPGFVDRILFRVSVAFFPPTGGFPNGRIIIISDAGGSSGLVALAAPYVNTDPQLRVGVTTAAALLAPNCIHGIVGGEAPWASEVTFGGISQQWRFQVEEEYQIVAFPDATPPVPVTNQHGWRANNPVLGPIAPNPLLPFIGADNLVYGNMAPLARSLDVDCEQPSLFQTTLAQFPYASV